MKKTENTDIVAEFWQKWEKADCLKRLEVLEKVSDRLLEYAQYIEKIKWPKKKALIRTLFTQSLNSYFEDLYNYINESKRLENNSIKNKRKKAQQGTSLG